MARLNNAEQSAGWLPARGHVALSVVAAALTTTPDICAAASGVICTSSSPAMVIELPATMPSRSTRAPPPGTVCVAWKTTVWRPHARLAVNARLRSLTHA